MCFNVRCEGEVTGEGEREREGDCEGDTPPYFLPGEEIEQQTFLTHSWIFKSTGYKGRQKEWTATANGKIGFSFKASRFGVIPGANFEDAIVRVFISDGTL